MLRLAGTCRSAGGDSVRARTRWQRRRRGLLRALRRRLLTLLYLNVKEIADRFVIDARHHVFKQCESLFLKLDDGIFLRVAPQADAFLQMVQREQVVFPLRINHIENNAALKPAHEVRAELFFFFLVALLDSLGRGVGKLVMAQGARIGANSLHVNAELRVALRQELRGVPLIGMLLARAERIDKLAYHVFRDAEDVIALVLALARGAANRVNRLPLLVPHVVVFQEVLAGLEI